MRNDQEFIERRIAVGLIVSTDYLDRIQRFWNPIWLDSAEVRIIADWCMAYYRKYNKAPDTDIELIYMKNLQTGALSKADAQYIEELLTELSDEFGRDSRFNSAYLYDRTIAYFKAQELESHHREVKALTDAGQIEEAEKLAQAYVPTILDDDDLGIDLADEEMMERIERAFDETGQSVITFPGAIGEMWNDHLVRGGFFSFLAPEKRGKSFMLLEIALRAIRQKANVAFFEAGDMTEDQVIKRICIYIAQRHDKERYCQERFRPIGDCVYNQLDMCDEPDRNCDHGVFEDMDLATFLQQYPKLVTYDTLAEKHGEYPDYEPCDSHSCRKRRGTVWLQKVERSQPLTVKRAQRAVKAFFERYRRRFKLACFPAGTLTVSEMKSRLDSWERYQGFVPDVIVVDYADLVSADDGSVSEFRHRQDHIWKALRALSQERHVLLVTATQADAESYKKGRLSISNFSEDKRKLAHVTAQYGLNQDPQGREKQLGIMRINEIVIREGEFSSDSEVVLLQDLSIGRPFLESYFS